MDDCSIVEKILEGKADIRDYDLNTDFDNEEIRLLLDEHIVEPRMLSEWRLSDLIIDGVMSYQEYPFEKFSPGEQLRQLDNHAISSEEFWAKINVYYFDDEDMDALLSHVEGCQIIVQSEEKKHE